MADEERCPSCHPSSSTTASLRAEALAEPIPAEVIKTARDEPDLTQVINPALWPDPTPEMLEHPVFNAIWGAIKGWDVNVPDVYAGYCDVTGNHARAIFDVLTSDERATLKLVGPQRTGYIDVVFDGPPGPESGRFVEVEDDQGKSVEVGEWVQREHRLRGSTTVLRLQVAPATETPRADRLELIAYYAYAYLAEHGTTPTVESFADELDGVARFRAALRKFDTDRLNSQQDRPLVAQMRTVADRLWSSHGPDGTVMNLELVAYVGSLRTLASAITRLETAGTIMLEELEEIDVTLPVADDSPGRMPLSEECRRAAHAHRSARPIMAVRLELMADMLDDIELRAHELLRAVK